MEEKLLDYRTTDYVQRFPIEVPAKGEFEAWTLMEFSVVDFNLTTDTKNVNLKAAYDRGTIRFPERDPGKIPVGRFQGMDNLVGVLALIVIIGFILFVLISIGLIVHGSSDFISRNWHNYQDERRDKRLEKYKFFLTPFFEEDGNTKTLSWTDDELLPLPSYYSQLKERE